MKKIFTILAIALCINTAKAQTWINDSVVMGAGKVNDVYYSLANSTVKTENNQNWLMAFSMGTQTAGVWVNEVNGVVALNPHLSASAWSTISLGDTATSMLLHNSETSWGYGALNANRYAPDLYDFGWGHYDNITHNVNGDSIYIIGKSGQYYKFIIDSLNGFTQQYYCRIGGLSAPIPDMSYTFSKSPKYNNANMLHVTLGMGLLDTLRDADKNNFELIFTKYMGLTSLQGGGSAIYPLVGVLSNSKIKSTKVVCLNEDSISGVNYLSFPLTTKINNIGADWKIFDGTTYTMDQTANYIVRGTGADTSNYYQIQFTGYTSSNGLIKFKKRQINFPTAIGNAKNIGFKMAIAPNPCANEAILVIENKETTDANITITNTNGQVVFVQNINLLQDLNAFKIPVNNFKTGQYFITVSGKNIKQTQAFIKQ
jgi:Secretion system C-terminal sorting domain